MNIDLMKVINSSPNSLKSRTLLRAVIMDLYPNDRKEMNILLNVFESGIPEKIKKEGNITETQYTYYVKQIIEEYSMQEQYVVEGLKAWVEVCISKERANEFKFANFVNQNNIIKESPEKIVKKSLTNISGDEINFEIREIDNTGAIEIVKYKGFEEKEMVVPSEINRKKVIGIGKSAYQNCNSVEKLVVAEGIEYIGAQAFKSCKNLREVVLPSTLKRIGESTFESCDLLKEINLPDTLTIIPKNAFSMCKSLEEIDLPKQLVEICNFAFSGTSLKKLIIPSNVKTIGHAAFFLCDQLVDITLHEGLAVIDSSAFSGTSNLKKIYIPRSVERIGENAFGLYKWCKILKRNAYESNKDLVIYCYPGSCAIEYARTEGYMIKNALQICN